jgi:hypothetical protein
MRRRERTGPVFPFFGGPGVAGTVPPAADAEDDARAERFLLQGVIPGLFTMTVEPCWPGGGPAFWYEHDGRDGTAYVLVDPINRTLAPAFDRAALAAALARATGEAVDASALPLADVELPGDGEARSARISRTWAWDGQTLRDRDVGPLHETRGFRVELGGQRPVVDRTLASVIITAAAPVRGGDDTRFPCYRQRVASQPEDPLAGQQPGVPDRRPYN